MRGKKIYKQNHAMSLPLDVPAPVVHMDERGGAKSVGGFHTGDASGPTE